MAMARALVVSATSAGNASVRQVAMVKTVPVTASDRARTRIGYSTETGRKNPVPTASTPMTAQATRAERTADRGRATDLMDKLSPAAERFRHRVRSSCADGNGIGIIDNCTVLCRVA